MEPVIPQRRFQQSQMRSDRCIDEHGAFYRFDCSELDEETRRAIHRCTLSMTDDELKAFAVSCCRAVEKEGKRPRYLYTLPWGGRQYVVCKPLFLSTIGISDPLVTKWSREARQCSTVDQPTAAANVTATKTNPPIKNWLIEGLMTN